MVLLKTICIMHTQLPSPHGEGQGVGRKMISEPPGLRPPTPPWKKEGS